MEIINAHTLDFVPRPSEYVTSLSLSLCISDDEQSYELDFDKAF